MRYSLFLLQILFLTVYTSSLHTVTIHVPGDQPTIQAGINACVDGDTVLVAVGTYTGAGNRNISFEGRAITVMSEDGPDYTIIDCGRLGRGFWFGNGEGSASVLQGFTIMNGGNSDGAGIYCYGSSPTISNNIIRNNRAAVESYYECYAYGGGIYYNNSSSPTIINNVIRNNEVRAVSHESGLYANAYGGGIYCGSPGGKILNNIIRGNSVFADCDNYNSSAQGGGIYSKSDVKVANCVIKDNSLTSLGYGSIRGGGVYILEGNLFLKNSILENNSAEEIYSYNGNPVVTFSDVQGGYPGIGNINANPLFITYKGYDYLLDVGSPCIDAGDPVIEDGFDWPGWYNNGLRSDMGAYGGPGNARWLQ